MLTLFYLSALGLFMAGLAGLFWMLCKVFGVLLDWLERVGR